VLVAEPLTAVWEEPPVWPGGCRTQLLATGQQLPRSDEITALIPLLSHKIDATILDGLPRLKVVANYAVGYDNVDVPAAAEREIIVTNTPDVLTDATADLTWALLLAAARRLREGLELATSGIWEGWAPGQLLGMELRGKTLGLLGAGRIGKAVAARAPGFGMDVMYWDRNASIELEAAVGATRARTLQGLLSQADVVSVHLPLTTETRALLGAPELASMKPGSALVNTARGEIVETEALVQALRSGPLGAAGLDVYETEPVVPRELSELPNAIVLPHLGSATHEARRGMWRVAAENVRRVLMGESPLTPV
jgi:glyoxylate reductase